LRHASNIELIEPENGPRSKMRVAHPSSGFTDDHRWLCATRRRGHKILPNDRLAYKIAAEKTLVETDEEMGVFVTLEGSENPKGIT
jgi:hypothetical protein